MIYQNTLAFAKNLDEQDEIKDFRTKFFIPQHNGRDTVYLTGNSLGLQPKSTAAYIQQELNDWANLGVEGHFHAKNPWMPYHEIFPKQLSKIVGALEEEVVVMNQLTVNLHLLMVSFYQPTAQRYKIICEAKAFPSDQYAIESQVRFHGLNYEDAVIEVEPREGEHTIREEDILNTIEQNKDSVALVLFGGVNYYTGQVFNIKNITEASHKVGALVGFDFAHATGNINLQLHNWNVDFACWCSYKYLNSGPGGVAGAFIHQKH
ncbi:MAG TPA: kynureninase, partial [Chitinophagaceae bacterium]|nr:kynureninase [Chitinophagaceae bacterium]